jgi:tartrate dehydrogenase/decarboxylase/D-malate dehydrogenase
MREFQIAVIPGDGIGSEIMPECQKILDAISDLSGRFRLHYSSFPWGCDYYLKHGRMMPPDALKTLEGFDAILFGAVGFPSVPDSISLRGLRLAICQGFEQYANVRPAALLPGLRSPLRDKDSNHIDFVVVRENTEGEYAGVGGRLHRGHQMETALQTTVFTRQGVERIIRFAFQMAQSRPRKQLVSATKSNAQEFIFDLWEEVFREIAEEYPMVSTEIVLVDALAARFVLKPESLDVVVASNLFADILTDLSGSIIGSLGVAPSANLNPERRYPSMFEPIHGSAPDIAGKLIANPIGMILSGAMMLDFLGEHIAYQQVVDAVKTVTREGRVLPRDLGGGAKTPEVGDAILTALRNQNQ